MTPAQRAQRAKLWQEERALVADLARLDRLLSTTTWRPAPGLDSWLKKQRDALSARRSDVLAQLVRIW